MSVEAKKMVYVCHSGHERHGEGCDCGVCNAIGKAYDYAIYDINDTEGIEPLAHSYGCAEDVAEQNAIALCKENGWEVVDAPGEGEVN